ncbi:hypothetical protein [Herbidospora daliensis]|uniref:hypothetical protein n=1 Tax=Herbidospora daliensis TaxID=295585 RepID=UPI000780DD1B|nr:hypothetical protein [Herbidospora daliensis]
MIALTIAAAVVATVVGWLAGRIPAMRKVRGERALTNAAERKRNDLIGGLLTLHATLLGSGQQRTADQVARILWPDDAPTVVVTEDEMRLRRALRNIGDQMLAEGYFIADQIEGRPR